MPLVVVAAHPDAALLAEKFPQQFEAGIHHGEPAGMLQIVVVMGKGAARIVGRIDVDALHLARIVGEEGLEGFQIVALNEQIVRGAVAVAFGLFQQAVRRAPGGAQVFFSAEPLQGGHGASRGAGVNTFRKK